MNRPGPAKVDISFPSGLSGELKLARHRYVYSLFSGMQEGQTASLSINTFTAITLSGSFSLGGRELPSGWLARARALDFSATAISPGSTLLVAGVAIEGENPLLELMEMNSAKKVNKPWGYELWLSGEAESYAFKKIFLREGNRTSLQYHRQKRETTYIPAGRPQLTLASSEVRPLSDPGDISLRILELSTPVSIDVPPLALHRLTAGSDLFIYEASTPELDDVIRVADDNKRGDGRISAEH